MLLLARQGEQSGLIRDASGAFFIKLGYVGIELSYDVVDDQPRLLDVRVLEGNFPSLAMEVDRVNTLLMLGKKGLVLGGAPDGPAAQYRNLYSGYRNIMLDNVKNPPTNDLERRLLIHNGKAMARAAYADMPKWLKQRYFVQRVADMSAILKEKSRHHSTQLKEAQWSSEYASLLLGEVATELFDDSAVPSLTDKERLKKRQQAQSVYQVDLYGRRLLAIRQTALN